MREAGGRDDWVAEKRRQTVDGERTLKERLAWRRGESERRAELEG